MNKMTIGNSCDGCGGCIPLVCPFNAISINDSTMKAIIDDNKCIGWSECASSNGGRTLCEDSCLTIGALVREGE